LTSFTIYFLTHKFQQPFFGYIAKKALSKIPNKAVVRTCSQ